jgi:hypothetical protein
LTQLTKHFLSIFALAITGPVNGAGRSSPHRQKPFIVPTTSGGAEKTPVLTPRIAMLYAMVVISIGDLPTKRDTATSKSINLGGSISTF